MTSKTSELVFIPSIKQAIEIIPVAITSAKYPGNRSAAARARRFGLASLIGGFGRRFFVAAFAVEFETDARSATCFSQDPIASSHRRIVPDVLSMPARQHSAPMLLVVLIEIGDLLFHRLFNSRIDP